MAVFRIEKTKDYTVMSNHHLRNQALSLKSKGLLSLMLSLPEDWNYTTRGLAAICKEGTDSIGSALKELEKAGYIVRNRLRDKKGKITDVEYVIYETPQKPGQDQPEQGERSHPIPSPSQRNRRTGQDEMRRRETYRELILDNICYDALSQSSSIDKNRLDELVGLIVDTVCSKRGMIRIAGDDHPADVVRSRFLKLNAEHIEYILDRMEENTTQIRNIKKYLLAALYNAPVTMDSYYSALVGHDLYGPGTQRPQ